MTDLTDLIVSRLDGYLDALSLMNGKFREYRYFSYLADVKESKLEESLSYLYKPHDGHVEFKELKKIRPWLSFIQSDLEAHLNSVGCSEMDRIYQAAWYVVEMIEHVNNYEVPESMYTCSFEHICNSKTSVGTLYIVPVGNQQLVLNMQRETSA